jgi:hypothetical protein
MSKRIPGQIGFLAVACWEMRRSLSAALPYSARRSPGQRRLRRLRSWLAIKIQECDNCSQFEPPSSCKVVDGTISPTGWCKVYVRKPSS